MKLSKKVIVITGATAGVGRAIAKEFAKQGHFIGLIARGIEKLNSTKEEIEQFGGYAIGVSADVSNEYELEVAANQIEKVFGKIDIWINNAMVTMLGEVSQISSSEIRRVMEVNYMGSVNGILIAHRLFTKAGKGHIIQIGSALAYLSIPLQSAYCASKHAIHGFIQSYRIELKANKSKIKISEIHLPAVNTPQFEWMKNYKNLHPMPVPPIYQPELIATAVVYISKHPRKEMWVAWPAVKAILGEKFAPWLAEWKLKKDGFKLQQTLDLPPTGMSNMWWPIKKDYGSRGLFNEMARDRSFFLWIDMHRLVTFLFVVIIALIVINLK